MKVQVWHHEGYDIAVPLGVDEYNFLCFTEDIEMFIKRESVVVGDYKFTPGNTYSKFGNHKKTSSGFIWYDGEPIEFIGHYDGYLLFTKPNNKCEGKNGYISIYFAWAFHQKPPILITVNSSGAGRVIEMK